MAKLLLVSKLVLLLAIQLLLNHPEFFSAQNLSQQDKEPQAAEPFRKHGIKLRIASGFELILSVNITKFRSKRYGVHTSFKVS